MKQLIFLFTPFLLCAADVDRVADLIETMRQLTFAGDLPGAGRLAPELINELAAPHPLAWLGWNQIGVYYVTRGKLAEAERAYLRGVKLLERNGTGGSDMALLLVNLSELYLTIGARNAQAEALARRALQLAEQSYPPDTQALAHFIFTLGAAHQQSGHNKDALMHFERALAVAGNDRDGKIRRGFILASLGVIYGRSKRWTDARDAMSQAVTLLQENLGSRHADLIPTYINLAMIHTEFKLWDSASAALEQARTITESQLGPDHPYMVTILECSAFLLKKTGHGAEARDRLRRAKSIAALRPHDTVPETWIHVSDLRK